MHTQIIMRDSEAFSISTARKGNGSSRIWHARSTSDGTQEGRRLQSDHVRKQPAQHSQFCSLPVTPIGLGRIKAGKNGTMFFEEEKEAQTDINVSKFPQFLMTFFRCVFFGNPLSPICQLDQDSTLTSPLHLV